jgi:hypothetical protein
MWIFTALWKALTGNDNYSEMNSRVETELEREENGEDITPKEEE